MNNYQASNSIAIDRLPCTTYVEAHMKLLFVLI